LIYGNRYGSSLHDIPYASIFSNSNLFIGGDTFSSKLFNTLLYNRSGNWFGPSQGNGDTFLMKINPENGTLIEGFQGLH